MTKRIPLLISIILVGLLATAARADDGWSLSKLNPFKKKESAVAKRARASFSDELPSKSRFPKLALPGWASRSHTPKKRAEPSTLTKLSDGTKDLFGKTKDVLMPWSKKPKKTVTRSRGTTKKKSPTSILTSWLPQKEEKPTRPRTVKDFIGQPRPGF